MKNNLKPFLLVLIIFLLGSTTPLLSQEHQIVKIDSILNSLDNKDTSLKKRSYRAINYIISKTKPETAKLLYEYTLSKDSSDIAKLIIYDDYSKNFSSRGKTEEAIAIKLKGLELAKKLNDIGLEAFYNITLANSYTSLNKLDLATKHLNIAEPLALTDEGSGYLWSVYYNRAEIFTILNNNKEAKVNYLKMWESVNNTENTPQKRFIIYVLVDFFTETNDPLNLSKFTEILSQHYQEAYPDMPPGHMPIKSIFEKRSSPKHKQQFIEVIKISDSLNNINSYIHASMILADIYSNSGENEKAIATLKKVENKLDSLQKPRQLMNIYTTLVEKNKAANNYKSAFNYKILESNLRDSITSEKMQKNIAELEVKYDTEKKEREIIEQKSIIQKKNTERNLMIYGIIAMSIITLLIVYFLRKRIIYQKTIASQTEAIQQQEITELKQKNKLLVLNSMIEGQEAERLRIANDLHDSLGGLLSTVKAHFSTIQKEIEQLEQLNITKKTNDLIDEACIEVRRISHNMMPHSLSISGLQGAIEDLGEQLNQQGFQTSVEINNLPNPIEETKKIMVYRLVQEVISNITKHADAKSILIQLIGHKNELNLMIEDDGKGFDYNEAIKKDGLGLKSINSRVEYLDGNIDWDTKIGEGTSITINIPV